MYIYIRTIYVYITHILTNIFTVVYLARGFL